MQLWIRLTDPLIQWNVLCRKNYLLQLRSKISTCIQLLAPMVFVLLLWILQYWVNSRLPDPIHHPPSWQVGGLGKCYPFAGPCISLAYAPTSPLADSIMTAVAQTYALSIGDYDKDHPPDIVGMKDEETLHEFISKNPNITLIAINIVGEDPFAYQLWYNDSVKPNPMLQTQLAVDNIYTMLTYPSDDNDTSLLMLMSDNEGVSQPWAEKKKKPVSFPMQLSLSSLPVPPMRVERRDVVFSLGPLFFYTALMFNIIILLNQIVAEKEKKLRMGMSMMGLGSGAYFSSWLTTSFSLGFVAILLMMASGVTCGFDLFLQVNPFILLLLFASFVLAMYPIVFALSALLNRVKTAVSVSFALFAVGFFIQMFFSGFGVYLFYSPYLSPLWRRVFYLYPPFNFGKAIADMGQHIQGSSAGPSSSSSSSSSSSTGGGTGDYFGWHSLGERISMFDGHIAATWESFFWLAVDFVLYLLLAWYLDGVFPGDGVARPLWFPFLPSYWGLSLPSCCRRASKMEIPAMATVSSSTDEDVLREQERVACGSYPQSTVLVLQNLGKIFRRFPLIRTKGDVVAVNGISFAVEEGTLFGILGHNGAGKTTTISMLTGLYQPSFGGALLDNLPLDTHMQQIRRITGVCPQFDILWEELTAREHLEIFAQIKRVPFSQQAARVDECLRMVELYDVGNQRSKTFSGGMKRRLSVAIAVVGSPRVVFLDEPTTGMDPVMRQRVWRVIQRVKEGRVVILTTHSMEECDALANRAAIFSQGQLKCIGSPLHLKNRFGLGYRLNIVVAPENIEAIQEWMEKLCPNAQLSSSHAGSLTFEMKDSDSLKQFLSHVEGNQPSDCEILDWGLSHTTLEEVFLNISKGLTATNSEAKSAGLTSPPNESAASPEAAPFF